MRPRQFDTPLRICVLVVLLALWGGRPTQHNVRAETVAGPIPRSSDGGYDWAAWRKFWSLQPIQKIQPPESRRTSGWAKNPIDQFVLARLEKDGLTPAPEADRASLLRRATFDLTGLPPTPTEIREFVSDKAPDAWEKQVDRLLASPHYGERWGRHWLDVARYVPGRINFPGIKHTSGDQQYRDYVVRAFNEDKPYDRFVTEQLAGDLLPPSDDRAAEFDRITAPAFLSIGAWFDQCTDPNRLRLEMVDDMVSTTSQAFLGLSFGCARCHDHKFDPIPTADYYALAGVFSSTRIVGDFSEYWRDGRTRLLRPLAMPAEVQANDRIVAEMAAIKAERWKFLSDRQAALLASWRMREADYRSAAASLPKVAIRTIPAAEFDGQHNLRIAQLSHNGNAVDLIETMNPADQWVKYKIDVPAEGRYLLEAFYSSDEKNPLTVQVNGETVATDALANTTGGWELDYQRWDAVATFDMRQGINFLRLSVKEGSFPRLERLRLVKDAGEVHNRVAQLAQSQKLEPAVLGAFVRDPQQPWPTTAGIVGYLSAEEQRKVAQFDDRAKQAAERLNASELIVAVTDQPRPADVPVHVRGDTYNVSKELQPRGMPRLLDTALPRPQIAANASGRLELAQWLTDPRNPLPARVMANRIWQWHFGTGIVATPSDFGSRGAAPTHRELLDWLASTLREKGGSIKEMHRLIMASATYRMSGEPRNDAATDHALQVDPEARLLWRFPRRRLEAEELYDAMLVTTNNLPPQPSGKPLDVEKSKSRALYVLATNRAPKGLGPEIRKMFPLFDYEMSGATMASRSVSATPAQSLFWLNSPLVKYFAGRFADRLLKMDKLTDAKRLEMAYQIAVGHSPDAELSREGLAYLTQCTTDGMNAHDAWAMVCQALYASDEFHYAN